MRHGFNGMIQDLSAEHTENLWRYTTVVQTKFSIWPKNKTRNGSIVDLRFDWETITSNSLV
jgi:hypothetical protein